jgi:hypothetical protein
MVIGTMGVFHRLQMNKLSNLEIQKIAIYNRVWEVTFCSAKFNLKHDAQRSVS